MCKYCELNKEFPEDSGYTMHLKDKYDSHFFGDLGFYPYQGVVNVGADALNNSYVAEIKIHYCPMCGRKLSDD